MSGNKEPQARMTHPPLIDSSEGSQELVSEPAVWNDGGRGVAAGSIL